MMFDQQFFDGPMFVPDQTFHVLNILLSTTMYEHSAKTILAKSSNGQSCFGHLLDANNVGNFNQASNITCIQYDVCQQCWSI